MAPHGIVHIQRDVLIARAGLVLNGAIISKLSSTDQ